jgi:tetratricopeptide (TPR) repeat protein/tRNA A-37 threonylcarbamoyl transferase component Bud32
MDGERWRRINELFHAAREQPESSRDSFLRAQCGEDLELYADVARMLREDSQSGLLDEPPLVPPASEATFTAGQEVAGRYRIVRFLGRGGMGEVFEAEDRELKERVALKTLLPEIAGDSAMLARFKQEIQLSRRVSHANVCRVFDQARHEGTVFLTMEFLEGETLAARLRREGKMSAADALPLLAQMAEGLDAAHRAGIIHRDFKPGNVMLTAAADGSLRAVITDFGLARRFSPGSETTATLTGTVLGTLDYMAPELMSGGTATAASDVYAFGTTAYRMVTGALPFPSDTPLAAAILRAKGPAPAPRTLVADLDPRWDGALLRALDPEPEHRFSRAGHLVKALQGETPSMSIRIPVMTRRRVIAGVGAAAVLVAAAVGWGIWTRARNRPSPEAAAHYQKGLDDIHAGAYFAATKAIGQAVTLAPRFSLAHARLAEAWLELDVPERASMEMLLARRQDNSGLPEADRLQIEAVDRTISREFDVALASYERIKRLAKSNAADLDLDLGRAYEKAGQQAKAIACYKRAAEGPSHSPAAWLHLGVIYARQSKLPESAAAMQRAEELYQESSNLEGVTEVAYQRGVAASRRREFDESVKSLTQALETAKLAGNTQQDLRIRLQLANNYYMSGKPDLAEEYAKAALDTAQANQMESLTISGLVNLGNAQNFRRDGAGAEKYYQEALTRARRHNVPRMVAVSLLSLVGLHAQQRRTDDVMREASEALAYFESHGFALESASCYTAIGRCQRDRGDFEAAQKSFQRSVEMAEKTKDAVVIAQAEESLGSLLVFQEQYPKALEHYRKSLELNRDPQLKGYAGLQCGSTLSQLGRYDDARAALDAADGLAAKYPELRVRLLRARAELEQTAGHSSQAAAIARHALTGNPPPSPGTSIELNRVIGLALLATGDKRGGLRECEAALAAAAKSEDVNALLGARLAVAEARIANGDRVGAAALLQSIEPTLVGHPESRLRALALMAELDTRRVEAVRAALEELKSQWGDSAFVTYQTRIDVRKLIRPLLSAIPANH